MGIDLTKLRSRFAASVGSALVAGAAVICNVPEAQAETPSVGHCASSSELGTALRGEGQMTMVTGMSAQLTGDGRVVPTDAVMLMASENGDEWTLVKGDAESACIIDKGTDLTYEYSFPGVSPAFFEGNGDFRFIPAREEDIVLVNGGASAQKIFHPDFPRCGPEENLDDALENRAQLSATFRGENVEGKTMTFYGTAHAGAIWAVVGETVPGRACVEERGVQGMLNMENVDDMYYPGYRPPAADGPN